MADNKQKRRELSYNLVPNTKVTNSFISAASKFGDIIHIFPSNGNHTVDEICNLVWSYEKNHPEKSQQRTRKQIEDGIKELLQSNIISNA